MKRFTTRMLIAMFLSVAMVACGEDKEEPQKTSDNNSSIVDPDAAVDDPEGTITLSMRNSNNGKTYLDQIYIKDDNFAGAYFANIGDVRGLGNVSYIPKSGWAKQLSVVPGDGYVAYDVYDDVFYRIFVTEHIVATDGGIIGANVKYQRPFKGADEAIMLDETSLEFPAIGGVETLMFKNSTIIPFTVESTADWCEPMPYASKSDDFFLNDGVLLYVDAATEMETEPSEATVTITTLHGKKTSVNVVRGGSAVKFEVEDVEIPWNEHTFELYFNSNLDKSKIRYSTDVDWLEIQSIESVLNMGSNLNRFKMQVKARSTEEPRSGNIILSTVDGSNSAKIMVTQVSPKKLYLIGSPCSWMSPVEDNRQWFEEGGWVLTETAHGIYTGKIYIEEGDFQFRFYSELAGWGSGGETGSIGIRDNDSSYEIEFVDGLYYSGSCVKGKGCWWNPAWDGGYLSVEVNLNEMKVFFEKQ